MVGIPGSGKSTFAERFADTFQAPILNRIKLQKDLQLENEQADLLAEVILAEYIKTKKTIVIEGGADTKKERADLVKHLGAKGYQTLIVWVQTDTSESRRRASKPYPQGSGIDPDDYDVIIKHFEAPTDQEKIVVISGKHTYATQLKVVLKQLALNVRANQQPKPPTAPPRGRGIVVR